MRMPMREFWMLKRVSVKLPAWTFEYGMLPKFVPMPLPGLVDRVTEVISINPTGVMVEVPMWICNGAADIIALRARRRRNWRQRGGRHRRKHGRSTGDFAERADARHGSRSRLG